MLRIACGLSILALAGCTIRYSAQVEPQRQALRSLSAQSSQLVRSVDKARKQRQRLISECKKYDAPMAKAPYPELRKALRAAADVRRSMQTKNREIKRLLKRFDRITRNKKRLYSDRPGWKQNQTIRAKAQQLHDGLKTLSEDAKTIFARFDQAARRAKLGTFDRAQLVDQATNQLNTLKKQLKKAGPAIKAAETQLNGTVILKVEAKVSCQTALSQMVQSQRAIGDLIQTLENDVQSIQKLMPDRSEIPICPGLLAHQLLPKMKANANAISKHVKTINAAGARCRRATR